MSKTKLSGGRKYNSTAVDALSDEFGMSKQFIRRCLSGDVTSETGDTIRKQYKKTVKALDEAVKAASLKAS